MKKYLFLLIPILFACQTEPDSQPLPAYNIKAEQDAIIAKYFDLDKLNKESYFRIFLNRPHSRFQTTVVSETPVVELGRVMFYDKNLSADRSVSCASCHQQKHAFSDSTVFSSGVYGQQTLRNSYALGSFMNFMNYYTTTIVSNGAVPQLFWDNRATNTQDQIWETLGNPHEMAMDQDLMLARINESEYYPILFGRVFNDDAWQYNRNQITAGLHTFLNSLSTQDSRFDQEQKAMSDQTYFAKEDYTRDFASFSPSENLGKTLFLTHCANCHGRFLGYEMDRLFTKTNKNASCNGLDMTYLDKGVGKVQNDPSMDGFFKIPSLRNIAVTGPYMHDGRFATLQQVIQFYNQEIQPHPNLDPLLLDDRGQPIRLNLSKSEVMALEDFLHTLTDEAFLTDDRWSDPFLR
ncbi:MAG: cytochrome c peroxidase [Bacteroidota bacterium]